MKKIVFLFLILFSFSVNAKEFQQQLDEWRITPSKKEIENEIPCFYYFRKPAYTIVFSKDSSPSINIIINVPSLVTSNLPTGQNGEYRFILNRQLILESNIIQSQPGYFLIVVFDERIIEDGITDGSEIGFILPDGSGFSFPVANKYAEAKLLATNCYEMINGTDDENVSSEPAPNSLFDEFTDTERFLSTIPLLRGIDIASKSLFDHVLPNNDNTFKITENPKTITYINDKMYGVYIISGKISRPNSKQLVDTFSSRVSDDKCSLLNISVILEDKSGFLINYVLLCNNIDQEYLSVGYLLYTDKTNQLMEFNSLTYVRNFPENQDFFDKLRINLTALLGSPA